jgi:hypothetical protein
MYCVWASWPSASVWLDEGGYTQYTCSRRFLCNLKDGLAAEIRIPTLPPNYEYAEKALVVKPGRENRFICGSLDAVLHSARRSENVLYDTQTRCVSTLSGKAASKSVRGVNPLSDADRVHDRAPRQAVERGLNLVACASPSSKTRCDRSHPLLLGMQPSRPPLARFFPIASAVI